MSGSDRVSGNKEACLEMQRFLKALDSYAKCFVRNPGVSFEQHHSGFMPVVRNRSGRVKQRGSDARKN